METPELNRDSNSQLQKTEKKRACSEREINCKSRVWQQLSKDNNKQMALSIQKDKDSTKQQ